MKSTLTVQPATGQQPLNLVRTIDLPRIEGRIGHLAIDLAADRLFVAALGNNTVEVIDLLKNAVVRSAPGFHPPQGILVVPGVYRVAVANGQSGSLQWLDTTKYDDVDKRLYVSGGEGFLDRPTDAFLHRVSPP